MNFIEGC